MKKYWLPLLLALILTLFVSGLALAQDATTITANNTHIYLAVGKKDALKLTIAPSAARKQGVTYAISDTSVATVDKRGNVTAVALGECTLTVASVYDPSVTLEVPVTVVTPVKKVTATAEKSVYVGKAILITCDFEPANATVQDATFVSSRENVATVSATGVITGVARGQAVITVRSMDGYAKTQLRVNVVQAPKSIEISPSALDVAVGSRGTLKATVLPKDADNKKVTWSSSDESVATVDQSGRVSCHKLGTALITATSVEMPDVSASVQVGAVQLAKTIAFTQKVFPVTINKTAKLSVTIAPEDTSHKGVKYSVKNTKIATVDDNGVITGLKGGKTTVYATTTDGSKKRASATIEVIVPVTGVSYKSNGVRVGAGSRGNFTAEIQPKDATSKNMTWVSSDESIATVTGKNNKFTVKGRKWGRCTVTGTTEDGGFKVTVNVNVGSLRHAVVIRSVQIQNGKPRIVMQNKSNMAITTVYYEINGYDPYFQQIWMSKKGYTLYGDYQHVLQPQEKTRHGQFNFHNHSNYDGLTTISMAITGWECKDGYYDNNGRLQYSYTVPKKSREWIYWPDSPV